MQYLGFQGQYEPFVLHSESNFSFSPSDFVVVPDAGALVLVPSSVRAFHGCYLALWDGLNRQDWEKRGVRQWLSRQVERLQDRIDAEES